MYAPIAADDVDAYRRARLRALQEDSDAFTERYADAVAWPDSRWVERVAENANHAASSTHVAWQDGEIVGMATGVVRHDAEAPELVAMWVAPEVRGRGVGARLVRHVQAWAKSRGADALELWVVTGNDRAIALYQRCGFVVKDDHRADPDDPCRNEVRMRLSIGPGHSRPTTDVSAVLLDSMDSMFGQLRQRLEGLTDAEYLWEPVSDMWSIRPGPDSRPVADGAGIREAEPAPVTTIAWRMWHLAMDCLDDYARRFTGDSSDALADWTLSAAEAIGILEQKWEQYRGVIADRNGWDQLGEPWGPWSAHSVADMAMHACNELVHHGAEIALLRDLYRNSETTPG